MFEEEDNLRGEPESDGVPVCPGCLAPYEPLQHYCEKCGEAVGTLMPYIPFVNIRFNYSIFDTIWRRLWGEGKVGVGWRIIYALLILLMVPIMLVGVPFVIWDKLKKRRRVKT